jgi:hypothetical protein
MRNQPLQHLIQVVITYIQSTVLSSAVFSLLLITSSGEQNTELRISFWNSLLVIIILRRFVSLCKSYVQSLRTLSVKITCESLYFATDLACSWSHSLPIRVSVCTQSLPKGGFCISSFGHQ